jgi:hypothetical protein
VGNGLMVPQKVKYKTKSQRTKKKRKRGISELN